MSTGFSDKNSAGIQVKSKQRVRDFAEVFTAPREVKGMCDLIPEEMYSDLTKTFLEPACGEGAFLVEILDRKLAHCKNEFDGLQALDCLYGVDIQEDNVNATRKNLFTLWRHRFPEACELALSTAMLIVSSHIVCDDFLNPQTETVRSWGVEPSKNYVLALEKRKKRIEDKSTSGAGNAE